MSSGDWLMMLETTLSMTFVPGANRRGEAPGASWLFLLPSLPLERTLCLGLPPSTTLNVLTRFSGLTVVASDRQPPRLGDPSDACWSEVHAQTSLPFADHSVDLVVVTGRKWERQVGCMPTLQTELQRLLKPGGFIYSEQSLGPRLGRLFGSSTEQGRSQGSAFWLTPWGGEASSLVPGHDQATMDYFLKHSLYTPGWRASVPLKQLVRTLRPNGSGHDHRTAIRPADGTPGAGVKVAGQTGTRLLRTLDRAATGLEARTLRHRLGLRAGILSGKGVAGLGEHPPEYLHAAAQSAGLDLANYRWGLVAPADYGSRKMLFFLFDRNDPAAAPPRYIVKMVRDPAYAPRLENEARALTALHSASGLDLTVVPRVVFFGSHAGLPFVGETVVDGVPLSSQSRSDAAAQHLRQAVEWLTELACATVCETSAERASETLHTLLDRFLRIYRLTPDQRNFLEGQLETLGKRSVSVPLVFQHGDPGLWNLLLTPAGGVGFLDWEAAEPHGVPLWDLLYLLRSFGVRKLRGNGIRNSLGAFEDAFLGDSPFRRTIIQSVQDYSDALHLSAELFEPLFYSCWVHRALKESSRLAPDAVDQGHYVNLVRLCIDRRSAVAATLRVGC